LRVGVHLPVLRDVLPDDENGNLVGRILHDVFLLDHPDKEPGALTLRDLLFDMVGRKHALKVTNGVISEAVNMVAKN
jgi:hypothetical protein